MRYHSFSKSLFRAEQTKFRAKRQSASLEQARRSLQLTILGAVASGQSLATISTLICQMIERRTARAKCCVALMQGDGRMHVLAAPSLIKETLETLEKRLTEPALADHEAPSFSVKPVQSGQVGRDLRWSTAGVESTATRPQPSWSASVFDQAGDALGTITLHFREPRVPTSIEKALVEACVGPFAIAIERSRLWERLESTNARFNVALDNISQGLCFFDETSKLVVANRRFSEIYGMSPASSRPGMSFEEIVEARIAVGAGPAMRANEYLNWREELHRDGSTRDTLVELANGRTIAIRRQTMPGSGWVSTHEDVTERKEAEAKIIHLARHDALTGLPNRNLFHERIEQALAFIGRGQQCAVLCLDIDHFKNINDAFGHPAGDALLQAVAARLQACVREVDTVTRLGGDEFAILLVDTDGPAGARDTAQRIVSALRDPVRHDHDSFVASTSIGVALAPQDGDTAAKLLKNADIALYRAKQEARGTCRFFEAEMDARQQARTALAHELRQAMQDRALTIAYQPVFNIGTGAIVSLEALLRWTHPTRGAILPVEFIPVAEETGLILKLGAWALRRACQEAAQWPEPISVSVNLSAAQFRNKALVETVHDALAQSGLPARRLELEITESVQLNNDTLSMLHSLRAMGVGIAMDDFGTGHSSLSYLRCFPFAKIKIDQSLIHGLPEREDAAAIVRAIIGLGRSLGMTTTAEGIETQAQLDCLRREGCNEAQGFLLGLPVSTQDLPSLLAVYAREPAPPSVLRTLLKSHASLAAQSI